jgi:hypothetical protein
MHRGAFPRRDHFLGANHVPDRYLHWSSCLHSLEPSSRSSWIELVLFLFV